MAALSDVRVDDRREVAAHVDDAPLLYTASGKRPIRPWHIRIRYSVDAEGNPRYIRVEVVGGSLSGGKQVTRVVKDFRSDNSTDWIADLVDQFMPKRAMS